MGSTHSSSLSSASSAIDAATEKTDLTQNLPNHVMEHRLYPGSGRMLKTFLIRNTATGSLSVLKTMYVPSDESLEEQQKELRRIKQALKDQPHVSPFQFWKVGQTASSFQQSPQKPIYLVRTHVYSTLSDRLASRPFLSQTEKLWIIRQLLQALQFVHDRGIVHGFVTTENIGLTSWNWVMLQDFSSPYKPITALPDDDPSLFIYYFQEQAKHGTDTTPREKRCYIAPERFYSPRSNVEEKSTTTLTPACDVFSVGCVLMETFLNGERALDLGDLMEYRREKTLPTVVKNKLHKIESSALRAACRHMLHLDPTQRLTLQEYLERLDHSDSSSNSIMPSTFQMFDQLFEKVTVSRDIVLTPDARMAIAASYYGEVVKECMGVTDTDGQDYFENMLGTTMVSLEKEKAEKDSVENDSDNANPTLPKATASQSVDQLMASTQDLLEKLDSLHLDDDTTETTALTTPQSSELEKSSLLLFLQLVLSTIRHVQRPSSKLVGLQLLQRLAQHSSHDARLQRIVPTCVVLLQDQDSLVRCMAIKVLTCTLASIQSFSPSDSQVFPQYIFKRVAHLISDPSLMVRIQFSECIPLLAETALRFLDISHAVRLYEAVGGASSASDNANKETVPPNVFADDVAKLLGDEKEEKSSSPSDVVTQQNSSKALPVGKTLISSTYNAELGALHETVSRWVVHITTDQSEQSSPPKMGLLRDLPRLCNFFGRDGVVCFILPQILTFLNDRRDWQLRASLFESLPSVCYIIGRATTEHFVLPCLETALVDGHELVMSQALYCLAALVELRLLSKAALVGTPACFLPQDQEERPVHTFGLFEKYAPLLLYPSADVRNAAIKLVNSSCLALGFPDCNVFLVPHLRPFLRFEPSAQHLTTHDGLASCLVPRWTRKMLKEELDRLSKLQSFSPTAGKWTSVGIGMMDNNEAGHEHSTNDSQREDEMVPSGSSTSGSNEASKLAPSHSQGPSNMDQVIGYLRMLSRSKKLALDPRSEKQLIQSKMANAIEGSLKLAQHIRFPNQKYAGMISTFIPDWYSELRDISNQHQADSFCSESCAIRSVSTLSKVYGLSLMHPSASIGEDDRATSLDSESDIFSDEKKFTDEEAAEILTSTESRVIEAASAGEWGSEARLDPYNVDTSLLTTKLKGLGVPTLPPNLGVLHERGSQVLPPQRQTGVASRDVSKEREVEWRPKSDSLVASSSPTGGHSASVSRLAVARDNGFFVSGSHDGTCRVWELRQVEDSAGILESSLTYSGHCEGGGRANPRVNDVAIVENSHSVVSGCSDGTVHVWRVDVVNTRKQSMDATAPAPVENYGVSRVSGSSLVRKIDPGEGEVLAVSHFNTSSASIVSFATQKGSIHTWDLRCAVEPFSLKHRPDIGYLTSMSLGNDRHWLVTGTSRGYLALWDIRFQQMVKLWQHSNASPVNRLATSFSVLPRGRNVSSTDARPYMFAACGPNECSMFDIIDGTCRQCFRVIDPGTGYMDPPATSLPSITNIPITSSYHACSRSNRNRRLPGSFDYIAPSTKPRMTGMVGSIGGHEPRDYLITGGSDFQIRYFDFLSPSKCYTISGGQQRPTYERVDFDYGRLITCRENPALRLREMEGSRLPRRLQRGLTKPETKHYDSITDLKMISSPMRALLSCSSDGAIKLWR